VIAKLVDAGKLAGKPFPVSDARSDQHLRQTLRRVETGCDNDSQAAE
jgi:hypothetical protein